MSKARKEEQKSSGAQARNTSDLRERWIVRRNGQLRPVRELMEALPGRAPEFVESFQDEAQARRQLDALKKAMALNGQLLGGMVDKSRRDYVRRDLLQRKDELTRLNRITHSFISEWTSFAMRPSVEALVRNQDPELAEDAARLLAAWSRPKTKEPPPDAYFRALDEIKTKISSTLMARKRQGGR